MRSFLSSFGHPLACLGAALGGAGIAWLMQPSPDDLASEGTDVVPKRAQRASVPEPELLDMLIEITAPKEADLNLKAAGSYASQARLLAERHQMLSQLINEGRGTPGMEAERDQLWAEALKRFSLWMDEDHEEALQVLDDPESLLHKLAVASLMENTEQLVGLLGFENYFQRVADTPAAMAWSGSSLGHYLGENADVTQLSWALMNHPSLVLSSKASRALGEQWPLGNRDALFAALQNAMTAEGKRAGGGAALVALAKRLPDLSGKDWVLGLFQKEDLAPKLKESIRNNAVALTQQEGLPLPDRLQMLRDFGVFNRMSDHRAQAQLIYYKVNDLLRADDDALYVFRNGGMSPQKMYDHIFDGMPEFHTYAGEVRQHILRRLAEHDSEGTRTLVSEAPSAEQAAELVNASRWSFYQIKPGQLLDWQERITETNGEQEQQMAQVWKERTGGHLHRYGNAYFDWLAELPPGPMREHAISAALPAARKAESDRVSELEALVESSK